MGLREILALAVVGLFFYVAYQLFRALRASRDDKPAVRVDEVVGDDLIDDDDEDSDELFVFERLAVPQAASPESEVAAAGQVAATPQVTGEAFQLQLEVQQLRRDISQLRSELDVQRKEIARLADEARERRKQVDVSLPGQGVSPEYNEALVCARRGLDVEEIAERCGITVAEAELVRTLAQGGSDSQGAQNS